MDVIVQVVVWKDSTGDLYLYARTWPRSWAIGGHLHHSWPFGQTMAEFIETLGWSSESCLDVYQTVSGTQIAAYNECILVGMFC